MADDGTAPGVDAVVTDDQLDPLRFYEGTDPERGPVGQLLEDVVAKLDAATALVYAIYHCGKDNILAMPPTVLNAYARCCSAFDPKGSRRG